MKQGLEITVARNLQLQYTRKVSIGSWDIRSTEVVIIQLPAVEAITMNLTNY